ncbi:serine protease [Paenibacillaceae bacterium]|nr:serine protease [Paenibacillaceae bacterium]
MRSWVSILLSIIILAGGGSGLYYMNEKWSEPVVSAASSLGVYEPAAVSGEVMPDLKELIRDHQKRVVSIESTTWEGIEQGSGFLYNDQGDVITNAHVVHGATQINVKMNDTSMHEGQLIGMDVEKDIAVIRVEALSSMEPLPVDKEFRGEIGDEVIAFGSPLGLDNTVTTGIISGVERDFDIEETKYRGVYQISAPITNGNSGGPLILKNTGKVVGINSAGNDQGSIGFSIPFHQIASVVEGWSEQPDEQYSELAKREPDGDGPSSYSQELLQDDAAYLIDYFYECLNEGDYVTAYSLLGSNWQTNTSYDKFREGYIHTMSVGATEITVESSTDESVELNAIIEAWESKKGDWQQSRYSLRYTLGLENGVLKIITGKGKKL